MADPMREMQQKINKANEEALQTSRRILNTATKTHQVGVDTLVTLHEQGEKIDHIEQMLDVMDVDLKTTDKHLREMEKVCGCCSCPCGRITSTHGYTYRKVDADKKYQEVVTSQPSSRRTSSTGSKKASFKKSPMMKMRIRWSRTCQPLVTFLTIFTALPWTWGMS